MSDCATAYPTYTYCNFIVLILKPGVRHKLNIRTLFIMNFTTKQNFWRKFRIVIVVLIQSVLVGAYLYQYKQTKKLELANKTLQQEKENLEIEKQNLELEKHKNQLPLNNYYKVKRAFFTGKYSGTLEKLFAELVKEDTNNMDAWIDSLINQAKYLGMLEIYKQKIKINSESDKVWRFLADLIKQKELSKEIPGVYLFARKYKPEYFDIWYNLGHELLILNHNFEAVNAFHHATKIKPKSFKTWERIAYIYRGDNKQEKAIKTYQKALEILPNEYRLWKGLGDAFVKLNQLNAAIDAYRHAVKIKPENTREWESLAKNLIKTGQLNKAIDAYRSAVSFNPKEPFLWRSLGKALISAGKSELALKAYHEGLQHNPEPFLWQSLGRALISAGKPKSSIKAYREGLQQNPKSFELIENLTSALININKFDEAITAYRQFIELQPDHSWAWIGLARTLNKANKEAETVIAYRQAVKLNPEQAWAWSGLGSALFSDDKFSESIKAFRQAITINPKEEHYWESLEQSLESNNQLDDLAGFYRQAIALIPGEEWPRIKLGDALISTGKLDAAMSVYIDTINHPNLAPARSYFGGWKYVFNNLNELKYYRQIAIIYEHKLAKSPENLSLLSLLLGDIELATKQNDIQRVHKRLKTALPLLTKTSKTYVYLPFLAFIVDPEQSFQTVLTAIEATQKGVKLQFNFTEFNSIIERQSVKKQQQIRLFIDYFKQRIDLVTLKQKLNESHDNSNKLSETLLNQ